MSVIDFGAWVAAVSVIVSWVALAVFIWFWEE